MMPKTIATLEPGDHLCCLYETEEEHRALLFPFLRRGLERGEKVLYIVDARTADTILGYLRDDGLPVEPYLSRGQLSILTAAETYTREGHFDPEQMIALLRTETERALAEGYAALRVTGEMSWMLQGQPGSERLIEYEARLNTFLPGSRCLAVCQYDRRRFTPALLLDVVTTHPLVVVGTDIYRNLYYIPPADFLGANREEAELQHRLRNLRARSQLDEMLRQSERKFRSIIQESLDGIALTDEQGMIIEWNQAMEEITGLPAPVVQGRPLWEVQYQLSPAEQQTIEMAQQLKARIDECLHSGWAPWMGQMLEREYQHPDGTTRFVQGVIIPIRTEQGCMLGSISRDITERRRLTEALQRERDFVTAVLDTVAALIVVLDAQGRIVRFNRACEQTTGYSFKEVEGRIFWDLLLAPEEVEGVKDVFRHLTAGLFPIHHENYWVARDGSRRLIAWSNTALLGGDGSVEYVIGIGIDITEQRRVEEERERLLVEVAQQRQQAEILAQTLARERDTLHAIIENTRAHLAYLDTQFRFVWVNSTYARGSGYAPEELIGRNHFDLFPHPENQAIFERVLQSGQSVEFIARPFEFPGHPERGVTYWDWTLVPVKDEAGAVQGLVLSLMDVTQRERIRAALGEYASRLQIQHEIDLAILGARSLAETANIVLDYILRLVPCQRASLAVLEPQAERALLIAVRSQGESRLSEGTTVPLSAVPFLEELQQGRAHLIADLLEIEDLSPPFQQLCREGVRGYLSVPLTEKGELVGAINIGLDRPAGSAPAPLEVIQELAPALAVAVQHARLHEEVRRHAAELEERVAQRTAELLASQRNYQALVDSVDGVVWELDVATFRFLFVSQQAERLLGYPVERWLSEPTFWQDHLHPEDRDWAPAFCARATAEKRDHEFEYRMLAADGRTVWLRDIVTVVVENDQPVRLRGIMVDITAQKAMQVAMLQNERLAAMGRLAATIAHEINNPLQSVVGCLDLAEEGRAEGRDIGRYLQVAREELQRLRRIVGQMRELYRPETGAKQFADLNRLVEEVLVLCDQPCRDGRIALDWRPAADLPPVAVAADRIKQVFLNLLLNAIEAMPEGGPLCVRTVRSEQPAGIRIEFQDSGIGIGSEALPRLFEPFYSTKPKGSGLGLFVSYRIVQEHGGTLTVDSRPGEGSTFTVWLPLGTARPLERAD